MAPRPILIAGLIVALAATAARSADRLEAIAQRKRKALEEINKKPLLDKSRVEDVFSLRRVGSDLVLHTLIPPTRFYEEKRAQFTGFQYPATVQCRELSRGSGQVDFQLTMDDWSDPLTAGSLQILSQTSGLEISKRWDSPDGDHTVTFTQDGTHVELHAFDADPSPRAVPVRIQADNFLALCRQYPSEVETYLRPMLREVRQEAALVPEPDEAWQALMDDWPVDGRFKGTVEAHLPALDADDFRERLAAAEELFKLGRDAAVYLLHMDRAGLSAEQRLRLDEVVSRYKSAPEWRIAARRDDPHFLADCLDSDQPIIRRLALARLRKMCGRDIDFDTEVQGDERTAAVNGVRDRLFGPDGKLKR